MYDQRCVQWCDRLAPHKPQLSFSPPFTKTVELRGSRPEARGTDPSSTINLIDLKNEGARDSFARHGHLPLLPADGAQGAQDTRQGR